MGLDLLIGFLVNLLSGGTLVWLGLVDRRRAAGGIASATLFFVGMTWRGFVLLSATLLFLHVVRRQGGEARKRLGLPRGPERNGWDGIGWWGFALAAMGGVGVVCRWLAGTLPLWLDLSSTTLLATVLTQRVAHEMGLIHGRHPFLFPQGEPVPIGTPGAVSLEGILSGLGAGVLLVLLRALLLPPAPLVGAGIVLGGVAAGTTTASLTAGYLPPKDRGSDRSTEIVGIGIAAGVTLLLSLLSR